MRMYNDFAPIILFVYNRPWHTRQTLEALAANYLADQSQLYIFADGPKPNATEDQIQKIKDTREVIREKNWCKVVHLIESDHNKGLAESIIAGVTEVVNRYGKVIVLEDDIVTSRGFLQYMNDALEMYKDEDIVMHISGYMFPVKAELPETFFYKQTSCWGWATWSSRWNQFENSPSTLFQHLNNSGRIENADIDGTNQFINQLKANIEGSIKTWAVLWHFSVFMNDGLCLHPGKSLVKNIGMDNSGSNCGSTDRFKVELTNSINVQKIEIKEFSNVYRYLKAFYNFESKPDLSDLIKQRIKRILSPIIPEIFKHKYRLLRDPEFKSKFEENKKLNKLKVLPRFTNGEIIISGRLLKYIDSASFCFIYDEIFNKQIYNFKTSTPSPYIIDAGANIGLSVLYFKQLFPNAEIIAFEPDEKAYETLKFNISSQGFEDVKLIKKALWDEETTLRFFAEGADGGRIALESENEDIVQINTVRLKDYLNKKVNFLKIDIEGAELTVLQDCVESLKNVEKIFVEYHSFSDTQQNLQDLLKVLNDAGFRYNIQHVGVFSPNPFIKVFSHIGMDNQLNIFAYRN